jgi:iron complex transport system substrate-binding protein
MRRSLLSLVLLLAMALVATGCGQDGARSDAAAPAAQGAGFPVTLDTPAGKLTLDQRPTRIVSMSPTATEMLFAIGAGEQVAAVDSNSNYPEKAPKTDLSAYEPNLEAIAGDKPDLVVYSDDPGDLAAGLGKLAIPALKQPAAKTLDDTYAQLDQLGRATGHLPEATRLAATMRAEIAKIAAAKPTHQLTYYHELDKNLYTATSKTFIGQLYASGYPQLSAEYIVKADPDLIFLADTKCCGQTARTVAARDGWADLTAVKTGAVVELDDDVASRWGPRVVDFLKTVAAKVGALDAVRS